MLPRNFAELVLGVTSLLLLAKVLDIAGSLPSLAHGRQSPVFERAIRLGGWFRDLTERVFRIPLLAGGEAVLVLALGNEARPGYLLAAAILATLVAAGGVVYFCAAIVIASRMDVDVWRLSGMYVHRADESAGEKPTHPVIVWLLHGATLFLAYAALYLAIARVGPSSFHVQETMDFIDALYLSATAASTVGMSDFYPRSPGAELAVITQIALAVTVVSLLLTYLNAYYGRPRSTVSSVEKSNSSSCS